jgi:hypothetical protein
MFFEGDPIRTPTHGACRRPPQPTLVSRIRPA